MAKDYGELLAAAQKGNKLTPYQRLQMSTYVDGRTAAQTNKGESDGYIDSALRAAKSTGLGMLGGLSYLVGAEDTAKQLQQAAQENARRKEFDTVFDWNYITDPEGALYDVAGGLTSMAMLAPAAFLLPESAAAGAAGVISSGLGRAGLGRLGTWAASEAGKKALQTGVRGAMTAIPESVSEWGNTAQEAAEMGIENPRASTVSDFAKNMAMLPMSNALEYMLLGGKLFNKTGKAGESLAKRIAYSPFRAAPPTAANAGQNAVEEFLQQSFSDEALGKPTGSLFDPSSWTPEQRQSLQAGGVVGGVLGGVGAGKRALFDTAKPSDTKQQQAEPTGEAEDNTTSPENPLPPNTEVSSIQRMRELQGKIPYEAEDGTNCMRTLGIALAGTPYAGQINVDQAIETAKKQGRLMEPDKYVPRPGDIAVVEDGNHAVMITENGGTIQNGASHNGVYESDQSPLEMFGKVKYYIRTSDYTNGPINARLNGILDTTPAIASEGDYVDEALKASTEPLRNLNSLASGQGFDTELMSNAEAQDNVLANELNSVGKPKEQPKDPLVRAGEIFGAADASDNTKGQYQSYMDEIVKAMYDEYEPKKLQKGNMKDILGKKGKAAIKGNKTTNVPFNVEQEPSLQQANMPLFAAKKVSEFNKAAQIARAARSINDKSTLNGTPNFILGEPQTQQEQINQIIDSMIAENDKAQGQPNYRDAQTSAIATILDSQQGQYNPNSQVNTQYGRDQQMQDLENRIIQEYKGNPEAFNRQYRQAVEAIQKAAANGSITNDIAREYVKNLSNLYNNVIEPIKNNGVILQSGPANVRYANAEEQATQKEVPQEKPNKKQPKPKKQKEQEAEKPNKFKATVNHKAFAKSALGGFEQYLKNNINGTLKYAVENNNWNNFLRDAVRLARDNYVPNFLNQYTKTIELSKEDESLIIDNFIDGDAFDTIVQKVFNESVKTQEVKIAKIVEYALRGIEEFLETNLNEKSLEAAKKGNWDDYLINATLQIRNDYLPKFTKHISKLDEQRVINKLIGSKELTDALNKEYMAILKEEETKKAKANTFAKNPDAIIKDDAIKNLPDSAKDIISQMPINKGGEEAKADKPRKKGSKFDYGDKNSAVNDLLDSLGLKKKKDKVNDVEGIDYSDDGLDDAFKDLNKELSKLSANPVFNPSLYRAAAKVGLILLKRAGKTFAKWAKMMLDTFKKNNPENEEKIKPYLGAIYKNIENWPSDLEFKDNTVEAACRVVGGYYSDGLTTFNEIYKAFSDEAGEEIASQLKGYLQQAFYAIDELENPTLSLDGNVVQSNKDNTDNKGGKENEGIDSNGGKMAGDRPTSGEGQSDSGRNGEGQGVQTGSTGQNSEIPQGTGSNAIGGTGKSGKSVENPASGNGEKADEKQNSNDVGGEPTTLGGQEKSGSGAKQESEPNGENGNVGTGGELPTPVSRRRINKGKYSILANGNYHANSEDALLGDGKHQPEERFSINLKAVEALKRWQEDGIEPTPEERDAMAHYTGWGGMKSLLFEGTWEHPKYNYSGSWKDANDKLREILGKEKWEIAWLNADNQFYTPPNIISKMWALAEQLGFKGGRVLEPSMGVGNFFALMPEKLQKNSVLTGVEIDPIAGEMAKVLYPDGHIFVQGYERHAAPENFYDFIIGNVPFGEAKLSDARFTTGFTDPLQIHDFFLVKNIGQLQPGGILMAITTHNTLDKANTAVRIHLAREAELVGALRLPNGSFGGTGTDVLTDVLIFKKRDKKISINEAAVLPWVKTSTKQFTLNGQEKTVRYNSYFDTHVPNVLGRASVKSNQYGGADMAVAPRNFEEDYQNAISKLPKGIMKKTKTKAENEYTAANQKIKERGLYFNKKGELVYRDGTVEKKVTLEDYRYASNESIKGLEQRKEKVDSLMKLHDKYTKLIEAEKSKAENLEDIRKTALEAFQEHVKKHGFFVEYKQAKDGSTKVVFKREMLFFRNIGDSEKFIDLASLDYNNEPAPILKHKVTTDYKMGERTISNAYLKQLFNGKTTLDIDELAKDADTTREKVIEELLSQNAAFKTPSGEYQPTNIYLSGNVVIKLREAEAAYEMGDKDMQRNIDALKAVRPKLVPYVSITAQIGSSWIENADYEQFIAELLHYDDPSDIGVKVDNKAGAWSVSINSKYALESPYATEKYGLKAPFVNFIDFIEAAMNKKKLQIKQAKYRDGKIVGYEDDPEATKKAEQRIEAINNAFKAWLWSGERRTRMELAYNDKMNAVVPPTYDASLMQYDGLVKELGGKEFDPRMHQRNFVLRALLNGRGGAYHEAGTGKTLIMSMLCMELRKNGKANKPLILAHNANAAQVARDIKTFYPTSKVLYVPSFSGSANKINATKRMIGQIRSGDWDAVVIPHEAVKKIAFSEETLMAMKSEELEAIKENIRQIALEEAETSNGRNSYDVSDNDFDLTDEDIAVLSGKSKKKSKSGGKGGRGKKSFGDRTRRALNQYKKILLSIKKQSENFDKDDYIAFENMDIDAVLVDECHVFKKTPKVTKREVKGVDSSSSDFGIKMSCIADYINLKQDNKGVFLFSGTMITNTIPEIHSMMRLVMPDTLKQASIYNLDDFLNVFTGTEKDIEPTADGTWESVERLRRFYNITELKRLAGQDFDIVNTKGLPGFELRALPNGKTLESKDLTEEEREELLNGRTENPKGLPNFKIQNVIVPKTKRTKAIEKAIQEKAQKWKKAQSINKMILAKAGWGLKLQTLPAAVGVSIRNLDDTLRDTPKSKVNLCVRNVMEIYHSHDKACQVIFTEKGYSGETKRKHNSVGVVPTPSGPKAKILQSIEFVLNGYNMVDDIVQKLVNEGIPRNEIAVIDGNVKGEQRADIAERVSSGEIRVVIGSSKTLGVGVNMQKNLRAAHHLDAVWMPGDLDQMNKRSKRQGNCWNTVLCYRYITPGFDGKIWSALAQKQAFISAFVDKDNDIRVIDGDALSIEGEGENGEGGMSVNDVVETLTNAVDDVRVLQKEKIKNKLEQYSENEIAFQKNKDDARKDVDNLEKTVIPNIEKTISGYKDDYAFYQKNKPEKFSCKIKTSEGWKEFTDKTKAEGTLKTILKNVKNNEKYCEFAGFRITIESQTLLAGGGYAMTAHGNNGQEYFTSAGTFNGIMQVLANIPKRQAKAEETLKKHKETLKIKKAEVEEKSPYRDIVDTLQNKLNALEKDIKDNPVPAPEWFKLRVPIDTYVEYQGRDYLVTGYSVKHLDQPYKIIASYTDEEGMEKEFRIPANKALIDGFPVLTDEEMEIDPKEEILDESDNTPDIENEIKKAIDDIDNVFSATPTYKDPKKATLEVDDRTFDVTVHYQTKPPASITDAYPVGKKVYVTDDNKEKNKEVEVYGYEKDVFGNDWQISTVDTKGYKCARNPYNLSDKVDGEPIMSYDEYLRAVGRVKKGEYDYDHGTVAETKQQKAAAQAVLEMLKGANIEVITDLDEVERVYNSVNSNGDKIENNKDVQPLTTPKGTLHGFAYKGKIYIDPNLLNANTPIHEYTHLWDMVLQKKNPALWKRGVELMKRLPLWEQIKEHPAYAERASYDEDFLASEVHARLTGHRGEEMLIQMAENEEASAGIIGKLKKWLQAFWYHIRDAFAKWSDEDITKISLKDFANMPLSDLAKGTKITEMLDDDAQFEFNAKIEAKSDINKIASAFVNGERKTRLETAKDFFKEHAKNLYSDMIDKNNILKSFDELTKSIGGLSVYEQAQGLPSTTAGMLKAITMGDELSIEKANLHLKNVKMKHKVTLAMVLDKINKKAMDEKHGGYLEQNGFNSWANAFGAYLGAKRLLEMGRIAKAQNEPYSYPKGLTERELAQFIGKAPKEFAQAADMFYKVNDNVISIMEDAQVFSPELAKALRTKYRNYCPLLRDFSDTAAADSFIDGLAVGGRGIGNVSIPLKKIGINGSERGVLNPLETTLKAYSVMLNRAERNKVGLLAVNRAKATGLKELIEEVPEVIGKDGKVVNAVADPKNCIFTVLVNGKKKAFKTTQELYTPIVGFNLPAANLCFEVARMAARTLRTGATMSPSFIVRNFLRDTIFAGISSKNGFKPFVDSIRGAWALLKNPELRAEFEAAGVTEFNFFSSKNQRIKSIDQMTGEEIKDAWTIFKGVFDSLENASAFVESSTRMGEFMRARKNGLTIEEAARAAREVTLDFSRSGRVGEQINQFVPFFNACLQGGDKMYRLFKEDPMGTSQKVFQYIVLPSIILMAMNWDKDWYKDLDPDIKSNYWCISDKVRIPKPQEAGVLFGSGIEALITQAAGRDKEAVGNALSAFLENMLPNIVPTLFLPLLEWQSNYNYFKGRQIVGNKYKNLPDELQYSDYTSEAAKGVGSVLKVSPMKVDNLVRGYTGTMGAFLWSAPDFVTNKAKDAPTKNWYEYYPIRDFTVTDSNLSRPMNEFYDLLEKVNKQHAGYGKKGEPNATTQAVRKVGTMLSNYRKEIEKITKSKGLTPDKKREFIDARKKKMNELAKRTVEKYKDKV